MVLGAALERATQLFAEGIDELIPVRGIDQDRHRVVQAGERRHTPVATRTSSHVTCTRSPNQAISQMTDSGRRSHPPRRADTLPPPWRPTWRSPRLRDRQRAEARAALVGVALAIGVAVGCTWVFLGVHFFSDELAGFAIGLSWFGLCAWRSGTCC